MGAYSLEILPQLQFLLDFIFFKELSGILPLETTLQWLANY